MNTTEYTLRPTRWPLVDHYLRVFIKGSQMPLGRVLDIHTEGMRLQTENAITTEKELSLSMEVSAKGGRQERVPLKASKVWSKTDQELGVSEVGFHISWPPEVQPIIENLIADIRRLAESQIPNLEATLNRYRDALEAFKNTLDAHKGAGATSNALRTSELISEVLKSRDAVQKAIDTNVLFAGGMLTEICQLDRYLKKLRRQITRRIKFHDCRASLNPSTEAWWWYLDQRPGWFWDLLPIFIIILALGFLVDIYPRIFSGGPNPLGSLAIFVGLVSTLIAAMGKRRQGGMFWKKFRLVFSVVLLVSIAGIWFSKPLIANYFRDKGLQHFISDNRERALSLYKRALAFNPNDARTHIYLGYLHEKLQNFETARTKYKTALSNTRDDTTRGLAINNLARLYILLDEDYDAAFSYLNQYDAPANDVIMNYYIQKNLGWALLGLGHLEDAKAHLQDAIEIARKSGKISNTKQTAAYCLLAQVFEKMDGAPGMICSNWEKCLKYNARRSTEEKEWYFTAREKLNLCDPHSVQGG
jgi:tetratricopeptide (TPR) repeat protein